MNLLFGLLFSLFFTGGSPWQTDFTKAITEAKLENKYVLLNFSGSDWCTPCIRMHRTIFESQSFEEYSDKQLVLVNADFPRLKKNQLSKAQQKQNDELAEKYNPTGKFPYTLLLDKDGKIVASWDGCPDEDGAAFAAEVSHKINDRR